MIVSDVRKEFVDDNQQTIQNNYLDKVIFGLGCVGGVGMAISIINKDCLKNPKLLLLAGAIGLFGISTFGLSRAFDSKKNQGEAQSNFSECRKCKQVAIEDQLKFIHDFELRVDENGGNQWSEKLTTIGRIPSSENLQNKFVSSVEHNKLKKELKLLNLKYEETASEVESLQLKLDIYKSHIKAINQFLGATQTSNESENVEKVRGIIASIVGSNDSES